MRKNKLFLLGLFLITLNLTAQRHDYKIIESRTFDTFKVTLLKGKTNKYAVIFNLSNTGLICSKSMLSEFINGFKKADTRKGFHTFVRVNRNGENQSIMIRHGKKSEYIGIGYTWQFQSGFNKIVYRENAAYLISYLEELKSLISCP